MCKNSILNIAAAFLFAAVVSGCASASGTHLVTGIRREAVAADTVAIYTEFPDKYEVIGIVTASSDAGSEQDGLNYAVAELKKQAAKIGANGVVIERMGKEYIGSVLVGYSYLSAYAQTVSGKAIYVAPEE